MATLLYYFCRNVPGILEDVTKFILEEIGEADRAMSDGKTTV